MKYALRFTAHAPAMIMTASLFPAGAHAAPDFSPWNADVRVADENIAPVKISRDRASSVYNGAQGAGFFLIRFFQVVISPQDGPNCRYHPTCSAYGRGAVERHGLALGMLLAGDRILRCNPYNPPVNDPVPAEPFGK